MSGFKPGREKSLGNNLPNGHGHRFRNARMLKTLDIVNLMCTATSGTQRKS